MKYAFGGPAINLAYLRARTGSGRLMRGRLYGNPGQFESHGYATRNGSVPSTIAPPVEQNRISVAVSINPAGLSSGVSMSIMVEQSKDGNDPWWPLGGSTIADVLAKIQTTDKAGRLNNPIRFRLTEQVYRGDVFAANDWARSHLLDGGSYQYHQLAMEANVRVTVETSGPVSYSVEHVIEKRPAPPIPLGQQSASLLGTFTAAEGAGALTTGSRTTTAGSLITGTFSSWLGASGTDIATCTDNKSNAYTEPTNGELEIGSGVSWANFNLSYNMAGTRGASHTVSHADQGNNGLGAQEWDGIAAGPTVTASAGSTGTGTAVSDAPGTLPAASLVVLVFAYDGSATTFAPNGSTSAQEIDENNDNQALGVYYSVAQTGNPTLAATLSASRTWGAIAIGFQETATAKAPPPFHRSQRFFRRAG